MGLLLYVDPVTEDVTVSLPNQPNKRIGVHLLDQNSLVNLSRKIAAVVPDALDTLKEKFSSNRGSTDLFFLRKDIFDTLLFLGLKEKKQFQSSLSHHLEEILKNLKKLQDKKMVPRSNYIMITLINDEKQKPFQVVLQDLRDNKTQQRTYPEAENLFPEVVILFLYQVQKAIEDQLAMLAATQRIFTPFEPPSPRRPQARSPSPEPPLSPDLLERRVRKKFEG